MKKLLIGLVLAVCVALGTPAVAKIDTPEKFMEMSEKIQTVLDKPDKVEPCPNGNIKVFVTVDDQTKAIVFFSPLGTVVAVFFVELNGDMSGWLAVAPGTFQLIPEDSMEKSRPHIQADQDKVYGKKLAI